MFPIDKEILAEMDGSTERAAAIVGHAHVEEECKGALRRLLRVDEKVLSEAMKYGFLQSHTARVDMLFLVGAFDRQIRDDLRGMANIRNEFAHNSTVRDFDHPTVKSLLSKIKTLNVTSKALEYLQEPEPSLRQQFSFCVGNAVAILRQRFAPLSQPPPEPDEPAP